jgi:hypothetical protein
VFGSDSEANLSHAAGVRGKFCATEGAGMNMTIKTRTDRMGLLSACPMLQPLDSLCRAKP